MTKGYVSVPVTTSYCAFQWHIQFKCSIKKHVKKNRIIKHTHFHSHSTLLSFVQTMWFIVDFLWSPLFPA